MSADGSNVRPLVSGNQWDSTISPDGTTVWFSGEGGSLLKMTVGDSRREVFVDDPSAFRPRVSPDGKLLLYGCRVGSEGGTGRVLKVIPATGGDPVAVFDRPTNHYGYTWTPDSKAIVFVVAEGDEQNLVRQPLDGSKPTNLTNMKSTSIASFALVDGGKTVIYSRVEDSSDAVMLTGF